MSALHALGEQGGWPLTMFLTPDGRPFWGGTYFPPAARYGRPGFPDILLRIAEIYRSEPERVRSNGDALTTLLAGRAESPGERGEPSPDELRAAGRAAAGVFDGRHGGIRGAPKFPNPPILNLLWRAGAREPGLRGPVLLTLRRMAEGGIHDHLGGGFARYSVDERWLAPHFEKMLYDNAQLLELYALAAAETGEAIFAAAAEGIVAWLDREMRVEGAFAASLDADSEGEEGRAYLWDRSEIESVLGAEDAGFFARIYDVSEAGNFEGRSILNRLDGPPIDAADEPRVADMRRRLLARRAERVQPGRDDKVLADWNGLTIAALARAGTLLNRPHWVERAEAAYRFIRESVTWDGALAHSWRAGAVGVWPAFALDHSAMALAAVTLAESVEESARYLADAATDLAILRNDHSDSESGALAMTAASGEALIVRPRPTTDDAVPNANGVYAEVLIRYAAMAFDADALARADALMASLGPVMRAQALAHASLWCALDLRLSAAQIVVAGPEAERLRDAARAVPYPNRVLVRLKRGAALPADHTAAGMAAAAGDRGLAFVCVGQRCSLPIDAPADIAAAAAGLRAV
jgi:uncharacterized protein YyaL (SSP411 family)